MFSLIMDLFFENAGRKLQALAKLLFCLIVLAGLAGGVFIIIGGIRAGSDPAAPILWGVGVLLASVLGGWLSSLPLYGLGVTVEYAENDMGNRSVSRSRLLSTAEWKCSCGATNPDADGVCSRCRRPRPTVSGSRVWTCTCGAINPDSRDYCDSCSNTRPSAPKAGRRRPGNTPRGSNETWQCACGTVNPRSVGQCSRCRQLKPSATPTDEATPASTASIRVGSAEWQCSCGAVNLNARETCGKCGAPQPSAAADNYDNVWTCTCGAVNSLSLTCCDRCSCNRPVRRAVQTTSAITDSSAAFFDRRK